MMIKTESNGLHSTRTIARMLKSNSKQKRMFDIIVRTHRVELTEKLREAVTLKMGRARQYPPRAFRARVHLQPEHIKPTRDHASA